MNNIKACFKKKLDDEEEEEEEEDEEGERKKGRKRSTWKTASPLGMDVFYPRSLRFESRVGQKVENETLNFYFFYYPFFHVVVDVVVVPLLLSSFVYLSIAQAILQDRHSYSLPGIQTHNLQGQDIQGQDTPNEPRVLSARL